MLTPELKDCRLCPRLCAVDRSREQLGYCRIGDGYPIASICVHKGEEPVISGEKGICNVFFSHCNLQCRFCQNHQISDNRLSPGYWTLEQTVARIERVLDQGIDMLGFVSASHVLPQMVQIIETLHRRGRHPTIVYNSGGYDKPESLRTIEKLIDVYLPDFKYMDADLARVASDAGDYPAAAQKALTEMYRQMGGPKLLLDDSGLARRGLIVRHLVLPGHPQNSMACLDWIAAVLSPRIHLSIMAQYHPNEAVADFPPFNRTLRKEEYDLVCLHLADLGFENGWIQDLDSSIHYRPDFDRHHPFE